MRLPKLRAVMIGGLLGQGSASSRRYALGGLSNLGGGRMPEQDVGPPGPSPRIAGLMGSR